MLCKVEDGQFQKYTDFRGNQSEITELKMPNLGAFASYLTYTQAYTQAYQAVKWSQLTALRKITVENDALLIGLELTTNILSLKEIDFQSGKLEVDALENLLERAPNLESVKHERFEYLVKHANTGKPAILDERIRKINLGIASAQTTADSMIRGSVWDQVSEDDSRSDYGEYQQSIDGGDWQDTWRGRLNSFGSNSSISGVRQFTHGDGSVDFDAGSDFTSSSAESDDGQLGIRFQEDRSSRKSEEVQSRRSLSNSLGGQQEYIEPDETSSQGTDIEVGIGPTPAHVEKKTRSIRRETLQLGGMATDGAQFGTLTHSNLDPLRRVQKKISDQILSDSHRGLKSSDDVSPFSFDGSELDTYPEHSAGTSEYAKGETRIGSDMRDTLSDVGESDSESRQALIFPDSGGMRRQDLKGSFLSKGDHEDRRKTHSLMQLLGRKLKQSHLHREVLKSSQKAVVSRDNQSKLRQLVRRLSIENSLSESESDVGSAVDGSLSSSFTHRPPPPPKPTHSLLRDSGQHGNTFGSETNRQPFFSPTGAGAVYTGENLENSRSKGSYMRAGYQSLRSDLDIQAEGRVEERLVPTITDAIVKVLQDNLKQKVYKNFAVRPDADDSKVTLLHKSTPVLEARSESVKVFKSLRNKVTELTLHQKALVVLGSLGIPPCPIEGIHVDTKGKDNKLADEINAQFDSLYLEEHEVNNPHSPQAVELTVSLRAKK